MTAGELKKVLAEVPDDMTVLFQDMSDAISQEEHPYFEINETTVEVPEFKKCEDEEVLVLF